MADKGAEEEKWVNPRAKKRTVKLSPEEEVAKSEKLWYYGKAAVAIAFLGWVGQNWYYAVPTVYGHAASTIV